MFAGCVLETSKDNLKALLGLVVLTQNCFDLVGWKCQKALLEAAKSTDCVETKVFSVSFVFLRTFLCKYTFTGSSKFEERQSADDYSKKKRVIVFRKCVI